MNTCDVSVVICTWNRCTLLHETLVSLSAAAVPSSLTWEVVVVDNNSTDATRAVVEGLSGGFPVPLRYVFERRQGKSWAMNAGIEATASPIIVMTDDDVRVDPEWLWEGCQPLLEDVALSYTGGPVRPIWEESPPLWFERSGRTLWGTLAILDYGSEPFIFESQRKTPLGVNFALRRRLVHQIGGFDTSLGRGGGRLLLGQELPEFFTRARDIGAFGRYVPGMVLDHHVPARRLRKDYYRRWWYGKGVSRARLEARHPVTELGLDLRTVPTLFGIPRFLFGNALRDLKGWIAAAFNRDEGARIAAETQLCYFAGQIRERLRQATLRGAPRGQYNRRRGDQIKPVFRSRAGERVSNQRVTGR
jgi:glycosyltransferase involved in cell wall biosynthesis